jgi:hypothetical protein
MVDNEKGIIGRQYLFNFLSTTKPKEGKMKKVFMLSVFAIVIAITIGFTSTDANAEDVEYQVIDYLVRVDFIPIIYFIASIQSYQSPCFNEDWEKNY